MNRALQHRLRHALAALLATAAALPAAHAELSEIVWDADGLYERSLAIPPGNAAEICGPLNQGPAVNWSFSAPQPLDFNIHYHRGQQVVYPARQDGVARLEGRLDIRSEQTYCWMWSNPSTVSVELRITLKRDRV